MRVHVKVFFLCILILCKTAICNAQNLDINLLDKINSNSSNFGDKSFTFFTNTAVPIGIATPIILLSSGFIKQNATLKKNGFMAAESFLFTSLITFGIKYAVNRDRPYITYPYIDNKVEENSPSFPSAHTSVAFSTATYLSLLYPKWYVIAPTYLWACGVAYSRMYLGVHYPSDILGGILIGVGSSILMYKLNDWMVK